MPPLFSVVQFPTEMSDIGSFAVQLQSTLAPVYVGAAPARAPRSSYVAATATYIQQSKQ